MEIQLNQKPRKKIKIPKIKLYGDRILIFRQFHDVSKLIHIPDQYLPWSHYAKVVALGDEVHLDIKVGDVVVVPPVAGVQLWNKKGWEISDFFIVRETEIIGKVTEGFFNPEDYEDKE